MHVPSLIAAKLKRIDRNVSLKWNPQTSRWEIWRRNPVRPQRPPELVHVWQTPENCEFLPLDDRLIEWFHRCDLQRKFYGRDKRYWGALLDAELQEQELKGAEWRSKEQRDELERLKDGLDFMWRNDRRRIDPATVRP